VGSLRFFYWVLIAALFLGAARGAGADDGDLAGRNIRLGDRRAGLYLTPAPDKKNPEVHNFTTTLEPLAPLDIDDIESYLRQNPELRDYRAVLIGPAVSGGEAEHFREITQHVLDDLKMDTQVEIIRHPKTLREKLFNLIPRREDYESPIPAELKVAAVKILVAESLSFTVLLLPPILLSTHADLSPAIAGIVNKIALPLGVAIPMVVLDIAHMVPLISFRRALSDHNIRLTPPERFARNFLMSTFFSFNFYVTSQWPAIWDYVNHAGGQGFGPSTVTALSASAKMLSIIIPTSMFNMFTRTTVGTSLNIWEQRGENRRFTVAMLEAITGMVIAPIYILSTMPLLEPVVHTWLMNINSAHLGLLGIGTAGAVGWISLEWKKAASWVSSPFSCLRALFWGRNGKEDGQEKEREKKREKGALRDISDDSVGPFMTPPHGP
jgi:hypothetical protein